MELYKVPNRTKVKLLETYEGPPGAPTLLKDEIINFHHLDGMYSYCTDSEGNTVHLKAWAEVEPIEKF